MDEKKEKSVSRLREEIAMFEPVVPLLELEPERPMSVTNVVTGEVLWQKPVGLAMTD